MELKAVLPLDFFALSDVGLVREHNEDVWKAFPEKGIFILADGMGGHNAGEVAAEMAATTLFQNLNVNNDEPKPKLRKAFQEANDVVYKKGHEEEEYWGMGTTLVALMLYKEVAFFGHIGDSRLYLFRDQQLQRLTEDHSLAGELIAMGTLRKEEENHAAFKHVLTKACGTHQKVEPTVGSTKLHEGDIFLLASDGLTNYVSDKIIEEILNQQFSLENSGKQLIELAKINGGGDNITLILVKIAN